jgi:predicted metal-dependent phosphoesterase TrpH
MPETSGKADLHIHTTASDGIMTVQEVLEEVERRANLDVIAITDHDRLTASLWAYEHQHLYPFEVVPGVEVTTLHGHVLALWVTSPITPRMSLAQTVAAIHQQGGIAVLAHPFHVQIRLIARAAAQYARKPEMLLDCGLDALEVHNAGYLLPGCNRVSRRFCKRIGLAALGNSDAHTLGAIGSGRTVFPGKTAADLRAAIETKQTTAEGSAWAFKDYRLMIADLIHRRGNPHPNHPRLSKTVE